MLSPPHVRLPPGTPCSRLRCSKDNRAYRTSPSESPRPRRGARSGHEGHPPAIRSIRRALRPLWAQRSSAFERDQRQCCSTSLNHGTATLIDSCRKLFHISQKRARRASLALLSNLTVCKRARALRSIAVSFTEQLLEHLDLSCLPCRRIGRRHAVPRVNL